MSRHRSGGGSGVLIGLLAGLTAVAVALVVLIITGLVDLAPTRAPATVDHGAETTDEGEDLAPGDPQPGISVSTPAAPTETVSTTTPTPSESETPPLGAIVDPAAVIASFHSPSGNIWCAVTEDFARCDILAADFTAPAPPDGCADGWGRTLVATRDDASLVCPMGAVPRGSRVLQYGESISQWPWRCSSAEDGVSCAHELTARGFKLARAQYEVF